jgi:hypothetical protein
MKMCRRIGKGISKQRTQHISEHSAVLREPSTRRIAAFFAAHMELQQ